MFCFLFIAMAKAIKQMVLLIAMANAIKPMLVVYCDGKQYKTNDVLLMPRANAIKPMSVFCLSRWQTLQNQCFVFMIAMANAITPLFVIVYCFGKRYKTFVVCVDCDGTHNKTNVCFCSLRWQTL